MKQKNILYILSNGRVAAIDKKDGQMLWEVKLKQHGVSATSYAVGQICLEGDKLFVGVSGILLCLDSKDGSLKWKNELKGWGYSFVSMANAGMEANAAAVAASSAASAGMVASTT